MPKKGRKTRIFLSLHERRWQLCRVGRRWRLTVVCPMCGCVVDITRRTVDQEGYVINGFASAFRDRGLEPCVTCNSCAHFFWPKLEGWKNLGLTIFGRCRAPGYWEKKNNVSEEKTRT